MIVIGQTVWKFDINRRVYGQNKAAPIWREHWREMVIIGETRRSWLVGYSGSTSTHDKIPKNDVNPRLWAFSSADISRRAWVNDNCHRIAEAVRRCNDCDTLSKIDALLTERK